MISNHPEPASESKLLLFASRHKIVRVEGKDTVSCRDKRAKPK